MFTGIIEELGSIKDIQITPGITKLKIQVKKCLENTQIGDSLSVNGVCLTICDIYNNILNFDVIPETLSRTNLGELSLESSVNLERAITPTTRLGGHFVQGHVDYTTEIIGLEAQGESYKIYFKKQKLWSDCIIPKGFICIDGISLTIVDSFAHEFSICLIPHTRAYTIASNYKNGVKVNIEIDQIAKLISQKINQGIIHV